MTIDLASNNPSRRRLLGAGAAAVGTAALAVPFVAPTADALAAAAPLCAVDRRAIELWGRHVALRAQCCEARKRSDETEAALPDWVRPGQQFLGPDGRLEGLKVGWPAIDDARPVPYRLVNVRPTHEDLWKEFDANIVPMGTAGAREAYLAALTAFDARCKAADCEREAAGTAKLEAEYERLRDEIFDVEEEIGALDCDYSPHATAAMALLTMRELTLDDDIKDALPWPHAGMFVAVLQLLRPLVGGAIAADVDRAIAAADDDGLESFMETLRDGALDESA